MAPLVPFRSPNAFGAHIHRRTYIHDDDTEEVTSGEHWEIPEDMRGDDSYADFCQACGRPCPRHDLPGNCS